MTEELITLVRPVQSVDYPHDVETIHKAMNRLGYDASDSDIHWAWADHSDLMCAGWLMIDDADDAAQTVILKLDEKSS